MNLFLAAMLGAVCGAIIVGLLILGYVWWRNQSRLDSLRHQLNQTPRMHTMPITPLQQATPRYMQAPAVAISEYPTNMPTAGVAPGSAWLDGVGGIVTGQRMLLLKDEMLLGRSGVCDLQFHDPKVSRQHAVLKRNDNGYFIQDIQSSRGTFINGRRVDTHQLNDHDQIQMGDTILVFRRM